MRLDHDNHRPSSQEVDESILFLVTAVASRKVAGKVGDRLFADLFLDDLFQFVQIDGLGDVGRPASSLPNFFA